MKINLFNRDGADLKLVKSSKEISPNVYEWSLEVDDKHDYILRFCRYIGNYNIKNNKVVWDNIEAIDPSGGPFISLGDKFENKYEIIKINSTKSIYKSENGKN